MALASFASVIDNAPGQSVLPLTSCQPQGMVPPVTGSSSGLAWCSPRRRHDPCSLFLARCGLPAVPGALPSWPFLTPLAIAAAAASDNGAFTAPRCLVPGDTTTPVHPQPSRVKGGAAASTRSSGCRPLDGQPVEQAYHHAGNGKGTQDFRLARPGRPAFLANGRYKKLTGRGPLPSNGPLAASACRTPSSPLNKPSALLFAAAFDVRAATATPPSRSRLPGPPTRADSVGYAVYRAVPGSTAAQQRP